MIMTIDELNDALTSAGRNGGPAVLFDAWRGGHIDLAMLRAVLPGVWSMVEYLTAALPRSLRLVWFRAAAYPKPAAPLRLYLGAPPRYARGWLGRPSRVRRRGSRIAGA